MYLHLTSSVEQRLPLMILWFVIDVSPRSCSPDGCSASWRTSPGPGSHSDSSVLFCDPLASGADGAGEYRQLLGNHKPWVLRGKGPVKACPTRPAPPCGGAGLRRQRAIQPQRHGVLPSSLLWRLEIICRAKLELELHYLTCPLYRKASPLFSRCLEQAAAGVV